jgi:hypothetical protein
MTAILVMVVAVAVNVVGCSIVLLCVFFSYKHPPRQTHLLARARTQEIGTGI